MLRGPLISHLLKLIKDLHHARNERRPQTCELIQIDFSLRARKQLSNQSTQDNPRPRGSPLPQQVPPSKETPWQASSQDDSQ